MTARNAEHRRRKRLSEQSRYRCSVRMGGEYEAAKRGSVMWADWARLHRSLPGCVYHSWNRCGCWMHWRLLISMGRGTDWLPRPKYSVEILGKSVVGIIIDYIDLPRHIPTNPSESDAASQPT